VWQRLGNPLIESITENAREVALFDMPNQIFLITATFNLFVISSLVPIFTKLLLTGKEEKLINWSTLMIKYMGIFCSITFGAFVLAGSDLIPLIIGSEYRDIFSNGVVLLLGVFPMIFAQLGSVFAIVYKEPLKYFRALCFAFLTFLGSSALLIPRYASLGCAMATCMSCVVLAVVMCAYFREKLFPCLTDGFKVIALGFVFAPFLFFRGSFITNLFLVVGFVLAYIFLLFAGRILSFREISEIFQALGHQPEKLQSYTPQPVDLAARE
jgi:O-antigen/teichoic acid export membrane protein